MGGSILTTARDQREVAITITNTATRIYDLTGVKTVADAFVSSSRRCIGGMIKEASGDFLYGGLNTTLRTALEADGIDEPITDILGLYVKRSGGVDVTAILILYFD